MEIIALRGPQNSGKTTTLKIVYDKLLEHGFKQPNSVRREISNGDFLAVLENDGKKIGIVTQGDYARRECSVKHHLRTLENLGCDVAICACTTGYGKDGIQAAINAYPMHDYVEKKRVDNATLYDTANHEDANKIMALLNLKKVLFILLNEYTDWEGAFLSTALHVGVVPGGEIKYRVHTVAPTLKAVRSIGGFRTLPDFAFDNMPNDYAALVLIGGDRWDSPEAELVTPLVQQALDTGKIIGAICNGASFLCAHGFLNHVKHTGNGLDYLKQWGKERYTNAENYVEAQAVSDGNIVTANGVGHLEFTREMLRLLKANSTGRIETWYDFYKNGFVK